MLDPRLSKLATFGSFAIVFVDGALQTPIVDYADSPTAISFVKEILRGSKITIIATSPFGGHLDIKHFVAKDTIEPYSELTLF